MTTTTPTKPDFYNCHIDFSNTSGQRSGMMFSKPTLPEAIAETFRMGNYYAFIGRLKITAKIELACGHCNGSGQVVKSRRGMFNTYKPCPKCKGKTIGEPIEFPIELHQNTRDDLKAAGLGTEEPPEGKCDCRRCEAARKAVA